MNRSRVMSKSVLPGAALLAGLVVHGSCQSQPYWTSAQMPHTGAAIVNVVHSGSLGYVYFGGYFDIDPDEPLTQSAVVRYASGHWDTLRVDCSVVSVIEFHDTLFVAGSCGPLNPADTPAVANVKYWDNGVWVQYGVFDTWGATRLRAVDDTLYLVGSFSVADGQVCSGIARRVGAQWQALPPLSTNGAIVSDVVKFQGDLVVSGNVNAGSTSGLARLHEGEWGPMGPGILGGQSNVRVMKEYQGDLYVAGSIYTDEGNPGRDIMRWDNGAFRSLGDQGLQQALGEDHGTSTVFDLLVHDDLLYVGGGFRYAGGIEAKGVATWDGERWCGVEGNLSDGPAHWGCLAMDFLEDTLFVGCGLMADDDTVAYAAKYVGQLGAGPCSSVEVNEEMLSPELQILINSYGQLFVYGVEGPFAYAISTMDGRIMTQGRITDQGRRAFVQLALPMLAGGPYVFHCSVGAAKFFLP